MLRARFVQREDSEHEQALIRVFLVALLFIYLVADGALTMDGHPEVKMSAFLSGAYLCVSAMYIICIGIWPRMSPTRRLMAMVTDFGMTSAFMHFGGEAAAPFYALYLWIALGNGFRYGLPYLAASVSAAVCGFFMVILTTPFWQDHATLGLGLLIALIVIPGYAATLIRNLTEAKANAEAANRAKTRFLATMSHELRTPLTAIIGTSDTLRETSLDRDQREMVETINTSGGALLSLINDILDIARIEANKISTVCEPFDLHRELAALATMLRPQAIGKGLRFGIHLSGEVPVYTRGDRQHLRQVLINLISNAIKFTERGYVLLAVSRVDDSDAASVRLKFDVIDTGIGIDTAQQGRIFERFTQADEHIHRRYEGSGLGLTIAKNLAELHGGTLYVESEAGRGSCFTVEIPFGYDRTDLLPALAPAPRRLCLLSTDSDFIAQTTETLRSLPVPLRTAASTDEAGALVSKDDADAVDRVTVLIDGRRAGLSVERVVAAVDAAAGSKAENISYLRIVDDASTASPDVRTQGTVGAPVTATAVATLLRAADVFTPSAGSEGGSAPRIARTDRRRDVEVLLVEDNPINQKVTKRMLEYAGFTVTLADDGETALEKLDEDSFDLMIVDVNMPGISGLDVIKMHRVASLGGERLPIIGLSADATDETRQACLEAGADVYLVKPVEAHVLIDTVQNLVEEADETAGSPLEVPDDDSVARISDHPRFKSDAGRPIKWEVIETLRAYSGDDEFVGETLEEFIVNSETLLAAIEAAVATGDAISFRGNVHALRGTSGNVGAEAMVNVCEQLRGMTGERLRAYGTEYAAKLRSELERFRNELREHAERVRSPG